MPTPKESIFDLKVISDVPFYYSKSLLSPHILTAIESGEYEKHEAALTKMAVKPGDRVLDIGSGFGYISNLSLKLGADKTFSYEAHPEVFSVLSETSKLVDCVKMEVFQNAVFAEETESLKDFFIRENFWSSSLDAGSKPFKYAIKSVAMPIDHIMKIHRPDVVIMDCEGEEFNLLEAPIMKAAREIVAEIHNLQADVEFKISGFKEQIRIDSGISSRVVWWSRNLVVD
jgi:FkbM family methyltransferase